MGVRYILGLFIILVVTSCSTSSDESGDSFTNEIKEARTGESLFKMRCEVCHGSDGKLGLAGAKDLSSSRLDSLAIVEILKNGKNTMPRQAQYFDSREEFENVIGFVKSLRE